MPIHRDTEQGEKVARPRNDPIGLQVINTAKAVAQALDDALVKADGSLPQWLALVSLKSRHHGTHDHRAEAVGVEASELSDQLVRMEVDGVVRRGGHGPELTDRGEAVFNGLLKAVVAFDRRLRGGLTDDELAVLVVLMSRLRLNISESTGPE